MKRGIRLASAPENQPSVRWYRTPATDPALFLALALAVGILIGWCWSGATVPALLVGVLALVAALVHARRWPWASFAWLLLASAAVGAVRYNIQQRQMAVNNIGRYAPATGRALIRAKILITSPPQHRRKPTHGPLFSIAGDYTTFVARVLKCKNDRQWMAATGRVLVHVPGWLPALQVNQQVEVWGWLSRPAPPANPGAFNYQQYLRTRRIFAEIDLTHTAQIKIISARQSLFPLSGWLTLQRVRLRQQFLRSFGSHVVAGNEMVALLLGFRDPSIIKIERDFSRCGAAHLLALSGLHVALIAEAIWLILRLLIKSPRTRAGMTLLLVLAYMLVTPCGPPVVRAALGTALVLLTMLIGRPVRIANILGVTALVVLLWRPAELFDASFQLSFLVTGMLIIMAPRIYAAVFGRWLARLTDIANASQKRFDRLKSRLAAFVAGTLTANIIGTMVSLPLVMYHYHQITPWGVVTGLLLFPLVCVALITGLLQLSLVAIWPEAAKMAAIVAAPSAEALAWAVHHLAQLPGSQFVVQAPSGLWMISFYMLLLVWVLRHHLHISRTSIAAGGFILTIGFPLVALGAGRHAPIKVEVLSLHSGNAVLVQTGSSWLSRRAYLIDAGTAGSPQVCSRAVRGVLKDWGVSHVAGIFLTQVDSLHAAGALPVRAHYSHTPVWINTADLHGAHRSVSIQQFVAQMRAIGPIEDLSAGSRMAIGSAGSLRAVWPPAQAHINRKYRGNILILSADSTRLLLMCRTQAVSSVLRKIDRELAGEPITGMVLLGAGNLHPAVVSMLLRLHPAFITLTGETRAAVKADARALRNWHGLYLSTAGDRAIKITIQRRGWRVDGRWIQKFRGKRYPMGRHP
jgi:competence protein ComEC